MFYASDIYDSNRLFAGNNYDIIRTFSYMNKYVIDRLWGPNTEQSASSHIFHQMSASPHTQLNMFTQRKILFNTHNPVILNLCFTIPSLTFNNGVCKAEIGPETTDLHDP